MEIERRSFQARQASARDMLRGDLEGEDLERYVEERVVTTTFEKMLNLARANSIFPLTFGLACCAIEAPISIVTARYDLARFGAEALRASPRQADLIILSGRVSIKMAPVVRRLYDQMLEPKWAISMGACSSSGGMFANYAVVQGADKFMPIDLHIPGCPPRPEAVMYGFTKLQRKIMGNPDQGWRQRYSAAGTEEWARGGPASTRARRRRRPTKPPGRCPLPDAPGLELIRGEIERDHPGAITATSFDRGQAALLVDPERLLAVLSWLRDTPGQGYRFLSSLHAADYLPDEPRFGVHYELLNRDRVERIRVKAMLADPGEGAQPQIDSCVELFPTANFQEREVFDFFGIVFRGHPELTRILLPEDYVGWPQRRDFPVGGEPVTFTYNERNYG